MAFVIARFINCETGEESALKFVPGRDTEETVATLVDRMRTNGWVPVEGSGKIVGRVVESKRIPMVRKPILTRQGAAFVRA